MSFKLGIYIYIAITIFIALKQDALEKANFYLGLSILILIGMVSAVIL